MGETVAELKAKLAEAEAKEAKALEKAKKEYEDNRDTNILKMITTAKALATELSEFKQFCHITMEQQATAIEQYGKLRSNSKGGFSIVNNEDDLKVRRRRDTEPVWDERSTKAVDLIKDFLGDTIKKRDEKLYLILIDFIARNDKGDLEYNKVMNLLKHEDKYNDPRWLEGLRLIKESFSNHFKGYSYEFHFKNESGKWQKLELNFSAL